VVNLAVDETNIEDLMRDVYLTTADEMAHEHDTADNRDDDRNSA
jgi:hypothetical protein